MKVVVVVGRYGNYVGRLGKVDGEKLEGRGEHNGHAFCNPCAASKPQMPAPTIATRGRLACLFSILRTAYRELIRGVWLRCVLARDRSTYFT